MTTATLVNGSDVPDDVLQHIRKLEKRVETLELEIMDLKSRMITVDSLKDKDEDFAAAASLPKYGVFKALLKYLAPKAKRMM